MTGGLRESGDRSVAEGDGGSWRRFEAESIYSAGRFRSEGALLVDPRGRIAAVGPRDQIENPHPGKARRFDGIIVPGAVNAHSHAFQIVLRGHADVAGDFREWVDHHMYPLALTIDSDGIELASRLAFAEMLKNGVTTVGEFFYLHNAPEKEGCRQLGNENSMRVIAAARATGIRLHLLRCLYDRAEKPGQRRFMETAGDAVRATEELAAMRSDDDRLTVSIAPHSLHGATADGIRLAADLAPELGYPFQIHVAEEEHDLDYARDHYGTTPGRALDHLGVISERLCIVHGVWLDADEIARLGEAGARCAYNPISNMALGDGVANIVGMIEAGMIVGLGCDGPGANHQVNVWQEMRFAEWLQRVTLKRMNVLSSMRPPRRAAGDTAGGPASNYCFEMGTRNGGAVLGLQVGALEPGMWADFVVIDPEDPSMLPNHQRDSTAMIHNIVNAMAARAAVRHVFVAGEQVVEDRRLICLDEAELYRSAADRAWLGGPG